MTMLGVLEMVFVALSEENQSERRLFEESREPSAIFAGKLTSNFTVYIQMVVPDLVFILDIMARETKHIDPHNDLADPEPNRFSLPDL